MSVIRRFGNVHGTLNGAITNAQTTATVTYDASAFNAGALASGDIMKVVFEPDTANEEVVYINGALGAGATSWTSVTRGQEGTTAVAHGNGTAWKHGPTVADWDGKDGGSQLIGIVAFTPGSDTATYSITATSLADVDAANLAVTFVAPPSGKVLIRLGCSIGMAAVANSFFGIREATTNLAQSLASSSSAANVSVMKEYVVSGLTPGSSHTYKWAAAVASSTMSMFGGPTFGPFIMTVWAVNL